MRKMFTLAAVLIRDNGKGKDISLHQGYRLTATEDEAIGSFVAHCKEIKPGFAIAEVIALEVAPEHITLAASEIA
jgi:hypothetical protein